MPEHDIECESFTVIYIVSSLVYGSKYYLQVHLENCAYRFANKQITNYLDMSEEVDPTKGNKGKEYMIWHYFFFFFF